MNYILTFLQRFIAGLRQFGYYAGESLIGTVVGALSSIYIWVWLSSVWGTLDFKWITLGLCIVYTVASIMTILAFEFTGGMFDIHLWTYIESIIFPIVLAINRADLLEVAAATYLGMVFFKGMVDMAFGKPFISKREVTDDPTGKTFSIPFLGVKIRRIRNGIVRLCIALGLTILHLLNRWVFKIDLSAKGILEAIGLDFIVKSIYV